MLYTNVPRFSPQSFHGSGEKDFQVFLPYMGMAAILFLFVCVEVLRPSQPNGVMSSAVSLPNHTFTGQA